MSCAFGSNLVIVSGVLLVYATVLNEFACPLKGPTPGTLSVGSSGRIPKSTALNSVAGTRSDGESANTGNGDYYAAKSQFVSRSIGRIMSRLSWIGPPVGSVKSLEQLPTDSQSPSLSVLG